jgi:hypothetical protein
VTPDPVHNAAGFSRRYAAHLAVFQAMKNHLRAAALLAAIQPLHPGMAHHLKTGVNQKKLKKKSPQSPSPCGFISFLSALLSAYVSLCIFGCFFSR